MDDHPEPCNYNKLRKAKKKLSLLCDKKQNKRNLTFAPQNYLISCALFRNSIGENGNTKNKEVNL